MADYVSNYSGDQIDEAVGRALPGGALDTGKAPAGFGLGVEGGKNLNDVDLNTVMSGGFYTVGARCTNTPLPSDGVGATSYAGLFVTGGRGCTQVWIPANGGGVDQFKTWLVRINAESKGWGAWEWVNPPMQLGVEYRTTERYLGKPVYAKVVNCGSLPTGILTYAHGIQNIQHCVRYNCVASNSTISFNGRICLPQLLSPDGGLPGAWNALPAGFTFEKVYIYSGSGHANCPAYATLYYTKTTD